MLSRTWRHKKPVTHHNTAKIFSREDAELSATDFSVMTYLRKQNKENLVSHQCSEVPLFMKKQCMALSQRLVRSQDKVSPATECFVWSWIENRVSKYLAFQAARTDRPLTRLTLLLHWLTGNGPTTRWSPQATYKPGPRRGTPTTEDEIIIQVFKGKADILVETFLLKTTNQRSKSPFWKQSNSSILQIKSIKTRKQTM